MFVLFFFLSYKKWIKFIFSVRGKVHDSSGTGFLASFMRVLGKQTRACKNLCLLLFYTIPETWMLLDHLQHLPTAAGYGRVWHLQPLPSTHTAFVGKRGRRRACLAPSMLPTRQDCDGNQSLCLVASGNCLQVPGRNSPLGRAAHTCSSDVFLLSLKAVETHDNWR